MAEVIQLARRRLDLAGQRALSYGHGTASTTLYFDLASPYTYLVA